MNKWICSLVFATVIFSLSLGQIRSSWVSPGEDITFHVNMHNTGIRKLSGVSVRVYVPELNILAYSNSLELDRGSPSVSYSFVHVPKDASPGLYIARVTASNDDHSATRHVWLTVV